MFLGEYRHALDAKGRLTVPIRLRGELGSPAIITRGYEPCLVLYPLDEWTALARKIAQVPTTSPAVRSYSRLFFGGAFEAESDKMGRILIPSFLRDYASIEAEKEVCIVGANTCVEVWDADLYQEKVGHDQQNLVQILAELAQMGV